METRVTLFEGVCANIFTQQKRLSAARLKLWKAAEDARISGPTDSSPRREWCEEPWPAGSATLAATAPRPQPERSEFQAGLEQSRAKPAAWRPTFHPHSRSTQSQIPEILCPFRRGCEQIPESRAAIWSIPAARSPILLRSSQTSHCASFQAFRSI